MNRFKIKQILLDLFILILIVLNIVDFMRLLPYDLDVFKKIFSWISLGLIIYHINIAELIFGKDLKKDNKVDSSDINVILLIAFFLLIIKDFTFFATNLYEQTVDKFYLSKSIIHFIYLNADIIDAVTFLSGSGLILMISIFCSIFYKINPPSILHLLKQDEKKEIGKIIKRFFLTFMVILSFYIIIFNFIMEWVAFVIDSSIIVAGIFFYLYLIIRFKKHFNIESLIHKIGHFGEDFIKRFMHLFYSWKGIFIGIVGIQVLHLIVDSVTVLMPFIFNAEDSLYSTNYPFIYNLYISEITNLMIYDKFFLLINYIFSLIGFILLMFIPVYLWWSMYKEKNAKFNIIIYPIFFATTINFFLSGIISIGLNESYYYKSTIGANILISGFNSYLSNFQLFIISISILIISSSIAYFSQKYLKITLISITTLFFGWYLFCFCYDLFNQYSLDILSNYIGERYIYLLVQSLFMIILFFYYLIGYERFLRNSIKNIK